MIFYNPIMTKKEIHISEQCHNCMKLKKEKKQYEKLGNKEKAYETEMKIREHC